jgi:DNA-binding NarL/FixJ family response regulator
MTGPHLVLFGTWSREQVRAVSHGEGIVFQVRDLPEATRAVLLAVRGHRLVALVAGPSEMADRLCRDLGRLGGARMRRTPVAGAGATLQTPGWAVLSRVARGIGLQEVACDLRVSRRTVDRRLAQARRELGVRTTTEAVLAYRLGRVCEAASPGPSR